MSIITILSKAPGYCVLTNPSSISVSLDHASALAFKQLLDDNNVTYDYETNSSDPDEFEIDRCDETFAEEFITLLNTLKQEQTKDQIITAFSDYETANVEYSISFEEDELAIHTTDDYNIMSAMDFNPTMEAILDWFPEFELSSGTPFVAYKISGGLETFKLIAKKITEELDLDLITYPDEDCYETRLAWSQL